jgi:hypothetical protein
MGVILVVLVEQVMLIVIKMLMLQALIMVEEVVKVIQVIMVEVVVEVVLIHQEPQKTEKMLELFQDNMVVMEVMELI